MTLQDISYTNDGLERVDILGIVLCKNRMREEIQTSYRQRRLTRRSFKSQDV